MGAGGGGKRRRRTWFAVALGVVALAAAGCGDDDDSGDSGGGGGAEPADTSVASAPSSIEWPEPQPAVEPREGGSGTPIKLAIMSECKGAFGAFDQQNMAGAVAALSQFAGAKPKSRTNPKAGFVGGAIGDHPLELVGVGCGDDTADT